MRRDFYKGLLCGALIAGVLAVPVASNAGSILKQITVAQGGIDLYVDGKLIQPLDGNGKPVQPFVYDGSTYLPLRALSNALTGGTKEVKWDSQNKRVYVGQVPVNGQVDLGTIKPYTMNRGTYTLESNQSYKVLDKSYFMTNAILSDSESTFNTINETNYNKYTWNYNEYITDSKYTRIKGKLITQLNSPGQKGATKIFIAGVTAQGEMTLLGQYEHKAGTPAIDVDCDITGVNILRIYAMHSYDGMPGYFYDATLEGVK